MRSELALVLALVTACASLDARDRAVIERLVLNEAKLHRTAWQRRDASLMIPNDPAARDAIQRRMNMTTSIQEMSVRVEKIEVNGSEATALSRQRFVRMMNVSGRVRQRISSVLHRQHFRKDANGVWKMYGELEELEPTARWVDEP